MEDYEYYVNLLTNEIGRMFEYQKEYIRCKAGCSLCCESGMYPFTRLEYEFIKEGFKELPQDMKDKVKSNLESIGYSGEDCLYRCPFLVDGLCSVYYHRGLICRTHGLITENSEGKLTVPYCAEEGLNYGEVYDTQTKRIDNEKVKDYEVLPKAYNLSLKNLTELDVAKTLGLEFGETKPVYEWLREEFDGEL